MIKITLFVLAIVAYGALYLWAEMRDAKDWLACMRRGMEP